MKNFEEIIAPLLEKHYKVTIINLLPKDKTKHQLRCKAVTTPLGKFNSVKEAAKAHKVLPSTISSRLSTQMTGYKYD
jgi:hypothetical protein